MLQLFCVSGRKHIQGEGPRKAVTFALKFPSSSKYIDTHLSKQQSNIMFIVHLFYLFSGALDIQCASGLIVCLVSFKKSKHVPLELQKQPAGKNGFHHSKHGLLSQTRFHSSPWKAVWLTRALRTSTSCASYLPLPVCLRLVNFVSELVKKNRKWRGPKVPPFVVMWQWALNKKKFSLGVCFQFPKWGLNEN